MDEGLPVKADVASDAAGNYGFAYKGANLISKRGYDHE